MNSTTNTAIALTAGMTVMLMVAAAYFVRFDRAGVLGIAIGAGLGLANLAISYKLTVRSLAKGMNSMMGVLMGGFFARLVLLVGLMLIFQGTPAISAASFALTFMIFFFANLVLEILLVSKTWQGNGGTA